MQRLSYLTITGLICLVFGFSLSAKAEMVYPNAHLLMSAAEIVEASEQDEMITGMGSDSLFRIVDVRPTEAFASGHIPGAVNLPFTALTDPYAPVGGSLMPEHELLSKIGQAGIGKDTRIVIYDDQGGFRAARLFWLLEYFGHRKVSILNGGLPAWEKAGQKTEATDADLKPTAHAATTLVEPMRFHASLQPRRIASADWILSHRQDPEVSVIDVRPTHVYKAGHIPWAISIPWSRNLSPDGSLLSVQALRKHFESEGITPDRNIVIHCQTGEASAHSYFALRLLGYPRLRVYHRSWAEWGYTDDLPKVSTEG